MKMYKSNKSYARVYVCVNPNRLSFGRENKSIVKAVISSLKCGKQKFGLDICNSGIVLFFLAFVSLGQIGQMNLTFSELRSYNFAISSILIVIIDSNTQTQTLNELILIKEEKKQRVEKEFYTC